MADKTTTNLTATTSLTDDDLVYVVDGGNSRKITVANLKTSINPSDAAIKASVDSELTGVTVGTTDAQALTNKTIDGDSNTISNLDIGNEVDWASALDVSDRTAFASGDKLLIFEDGVGLRKIDYDDLPSGGTVDVVSNVAQDRLLGRISAGSGDSEELTAAQVRTLLNVENNAAADQAWGEIAGTLSNQTDLQSALDAKLANVVEDTTPQLGGALDAQGNNITELGDVTFKTGVAGGTLRTGTSAADKFQLQAYDVDGAAYKTVIELDAGNDPLLRLDADFLRIYDDADGTKGVAWDVSGAAAGFDTTFAFAQTAARTVTFQDATDTVVMRATTDTLTNKTIDGDNNTLSNLDLGNEVDWAAADDVTTASAFASGDKVLVYEAGVGMRKVDYDDLPSGTATASSGGVVYAETASAAPTTGDFLLAGALSGNHDTISNGYSDNDTIHEVIFRDGTAWEYAACRFVNDTSGARLDRTTDYLFIASSTGSKLSLGASAIAFVEKHQVNYRRCRVSRITTDQTLATAAFDVLEYNNVEYDPLGIYDNVTNYDFTFGFGLDGLWQYNAQSMLSGSGTPAKTHLFREQTTGEYIARFTLTSSGPGFFSPAGIKQIIENEVWAGEGYISVAGGTFLQDSYLDLIWVQP